MTLDTFVINGAINVTLRSEPDGTVTISGLTTDQARALFRRAIRSTEREYKDAKFQSAADMITEIQSDYEEVNSVLGRIMTQKRDSK